MGKKRLHEHKEADPFFMDKLKVEISPPSGSGKDKTVDLRPYDHARAYLNPHSKKNWQEIETIVAKEGFGVSERRVRSEELMELEGAIEYSLEWPSPKEKNRDYSIFSQAIARETQALGLNDEEHAHTSKKILASLKQSLFFGMLLGKEGSKNRKANLWSHVEAVAALTQTDDLDVYDRLVLRLVAKWHDGGKAFDVGADKLQLHSLISANVIKEVLLDPEIRLIVQRNVIAYDQTREDKKLSEKIIDYYDQFVSDVTEIIRLHHVLEKIDKGEFDIEVVSQIFSNLSVNQLANFGSLMVADGLSHVEEDSNANNAGNERRIQNLTTNIRNFILIIEVMNRKDCPPELKQIVTRVPQKVLEMLILNIERLQDFDENQVFE